MPSRENQIYNLPCPSEAGIFLARLTCSLGFLSFKALAYNDCPQI